MHLEGRGKKYIKKSREKPGKKNQIVINVPLERLHLLLNRTATDTLQFEKRNEEH